METKIQSSKLIKWAVAIAIVIVTNLFFHYVIALFYQEPKFETFCPINNMQYQNAESCVNAGGQWTNNYYAPAEITKAIKDGQPLGWCDPNFTCQKEYDDTHSVYNRNVFLVLVILSIVVLAVGAFLSIDVLSMGFSWAGVVSLIIASMMYWSDANNFLKVVILGLALSALVWLSVKKLHTSDKDIKKLKGGN